MVITDAGMHYLGQRSRELHFDVFSPFCSDHTTDNIDRLIRYQNRYTALHHAGRAPRDTEMRRHVGHMLQASMKRGVKLPFNWLVSAPQELKPPFRERRHNPPLQAFAPVDLGITSLVLGTMVAAVIVLERAARALGLLR